MMYNQRTKTLKWVCYWCWIIMSTDISHTLVQSPIKSQTAADADVSVALPRPVQQGFKGHQYEEDHRVFEKNVFVQAPTTDAHPLSEHRETSRILFEEHIV